MLVLTLISTHILDILNSITPSHTAVGSAYQKFSKNSISQLLPRLFKQEFAPRKSVHLKLCWLPFRDDHQHDYSGVTDFC